jgi:hypothetical protein
LKRQREFWGKKKNIIEMEESREKGGEREVKKQGLMVKKLKRGMLVGKRGGPCTPPPTWRLELNDNNSNNNIQEFLTFPNPTTSTSISARKLCSNLWEIQPHHHCNGVTRPRRHQRRNKRFQISKHLVDPPNTPPHQVPLLPAFTMLFSLYCLLNLNVLFSLDILLLASSLVNTVSSFN